MRKAIVTLYAVCALSVSGMAQQSPSVTPRFEVASVKAAPDLALDSRQEGDRVLLGVSLRSLIARAYGLDLVTRTGLTGRYDWDVIEPMPGSVDPNAPSSSGSALLIAEIERQLGLKVEAARGKVEFFVIDSVEPPTPD